MDICATVVEPLKTLSQHLAFCMLLMVTLIALASCVVQKNPTMVVHVLHACPIRRDYLQLLAVAGQYSELLDFAIHVPGCCCPSNVEEVSIRRTKSIQRYIADT